MPVTEQDALRAMGAFKELSGQPELQAKAKLIHDTYRSEQEAAGKPLFEGLKREQAQQQLKEQAQQQLKVRKLFQDREKHGLPDDARASIDETFRENPDEKYALFNRKFFETSGIPKEQVDSLGDALIKDYSKRTWGEEVADNKAFSERLGADFDMEDQLGDYAQKAALKGLTAQEAIATLPDEIKQSDSFKRQSAKFSKSVEDTAADTEMRISPYRETINNTVEDLKATMGVDGATGEKSSFSDFANRLIEVPAEDRDLVLSAIIENGGDGEPNKKWTQKIAENFSRGSRDIVLDIPAFGSRAMLVNLKARAASGALVEGDPKTAEDYLRGLNSVATAALDSASMGTAIPSPTNAPNEKVKADALAMIEKGLDTIDLGARIREIADNDIDPASGEYMVTRGLYAAARSIPYTVVAIIPGGTIVNSAALAEQSYQTLRRSNPGMGRDEAMMISAVAGPIMGALEKVSAAVLTGKLPTVGRFMNQAVATKGGAALRFAVRGVEGTAVEMVQENLQDFTPYAVHGVVAGLGADVPDIPWEKVYGGNFWEQQGELFFAVLPLAMFGAGAGSISDFKEARKLIASPDYVASLTGDTATATIISDLGKAGKYSEAQTLLRSELKRSGQDTKEIQKTRIEAAQSIQREAVAQKEAIEKGEDLGIIPIVTPKRNVKIGEDIFETAYLVRFNDKTERTFATYTEANEARWAHSGSRNIRFHEEVVSTISHADRTQREGQGTRYVMTGQDETLLKRVERGEVSREAALNRADTASDVDNQVFGAEKIRKLNVVNQTNEATTGMPNVSVSPLTQNSPGSPYYQASINIEGKDTAGHVSIKKLDDGTAVLSDIQIGYEGDVGRGKGHGTLAYAEIGKQLANIGITLQSTRWSKHQTSISPQSLKVWAKLEAMGLAKQTGSNESKVYDRQSGEDSVEVIPEYDFVPANTDGEVTATETNAPLTKTSSDFKDPDSFYRVIVGDEAFQDIVDSGVVRTNARTKPPAFSGGEISLANRPTRWPSFSKGKASMSYAASNPNNYIVVSSDSSIQPSKKGKHGEGTTMFPTDQNGEAMESLDASKVDVYKHIGEGRYDLVYSKGKQVGQLTNEEIKAGIADEYDENFTASEIKALNEDDRLNSLIILGENVTEFENGLYITTAKLHNGATWATVIEEKLEGDASVMIEKGRRDWLLKSLRSFDVLSGDRIFRADSEGQETDTDIKEAYARAGLGYFIGTEGEKGGFQASAKFRKRYQGFVTAGLSGSMEGYARFFSSVAIRADSLQQMRKKGVLDPELERELARSTGYGEQAQYEDSVFEEVAANVEAMKASGFVATDDAPFSVIRNELGFEQGKMKIGDLPRDIKEAMFNEYAMFVNHSATEREFYKKSVPFGMIKIADLKIEEIPNSQIQPFKGVDSMPPILIADGKLIDGQHRIQSARNAGKVAIRFIDVTGLTDTSDSGAGFISDLPGYSEQSFSTLSNAQQEESPAMVDDAPFSVIANNFSQLLQVSKSKRSIKLSSGVVEVGDFSDNVTQVSSANGKDSGVKIGIAKIADIEGILRTNQPEERSRVDALKIRITADGGFISPILVSAQGDVIEGQHRLVAMSELGAKEIPVAVLYEAEDFIPDIESLREVLSSAGLHREQAGQMIANIGEIIVDENGDATALKDYDAPQGFAKSWNDALREIERQSSEGPSFSVLSNAQDTEYLNLAKDPEANREKLQAMVDEAAKAAGYSVGPVNHRTLGNFTVFDLSRASKSAVWGPAIYASFDANWNPSALSGGKNISGYVGGKVIDFTKPITPEDAAILSNFLGREIRDSMPFITLEKRYGSVAEGLKAAGYSAAIHNGPGSTGRHIAVFSPNQIKSADPVTYDESGNVIPLSQRFNPARDEISYSVLSNVDQKIAEIFTPYLRDPEQRFRIVQEVQKRSAEKGREWQLILNANRTNAEIEAERKTVENDLIGQKLETLSPSELGALEAQGVLDDVGMRPILSDLLREKFYKSKSGKSVRYWTGSLMSKSAAAREGIDTKGGEWDGIPEGLPPYVWGGSITPDQAATRFGFETQEEFWTALESEIVSFQNLKEDTKQAMSRIREIEKEAKAESKVWAEDQRKSKDTPLENLLTKRIDTVIKSGKNKGKPTTKMVGRLDFDKSPIGDIPAGFRGNEITPAEAAQSLGISEDEFWDRLRTHINLSDARTFGIDRATLIGAMRTLDAMISALPTELRGKIGGFTKLAQYTSPQALLNELERRSQKLDSVLSKYIKDEFRSRIGKILKKSEQSKKAGKKDFGGLGAMGHAWFDFAREVAGLGPIQLDATIAGLEEIVNKPDLTPAHFAEISAWVGEIITDEDTARDWYQERLDIAEIAGGTTWGNIDTGERERRNELSEEDFEAAHEFLKDAYTENRLNHLHNVALRRERWKGLRETMVGIVGGKANDPARIRQKDRDQKSLSRTLEGMFDEGLDFALFTEDVLGDSPIAKEVIEWARKADIAEKDAMKSRQIEFGDFIRALMPGKKLIARLSALDDLAQPRDVPGVEIKGHQAFMSELQAVHYLMLAEDPTSREWLDGEGYSDDVMEGLRRFVSSNAISVQSFLKNQYDEQYFRINAVYREIKGANLPRVQFYAPRLVEHTLTTKESVPGSDASREGGMSTDFLKRRVPVPKGEPVPTDALSVYWSNAFKIEHYIAFAEVVRDLRATLGHKDTRLSIEAHRGPAKANAAQQWISDIDANGRKNAAANTFMARVLNRTATAFAQTALGYKLVTVVKQAPAMLASASHIGLKEYGASLGNVLSGNAPVSIAEMYQTPLIQRRVNRGESEAKIAAKGGKKPTLSLPGKSHFYAEKGLDIGLEGLSEADAGFTSVSAAVAFDSHFRAAERAGFDTATAMQIAEDQTEDTIGRTAQPDSVINKSAFELSLGNGRLFFMFQGPSRQQFAIQYLAAKNAMRGKAEAKDYRTLANALFIHHFIVPSMIQATGNMMRYLMSDDDWDETWEAGDFVKAWILGPLTGALWMGTAFEALATYVGGVQKRFGGGPMDVAKDVFSGLESIFGGTDEVEFKDVMNFLNSISKAVGGDAAAIGVSVNILKQLLGIYDRVSDQD